MLTPEQTRVNSLGKREVKSPLQFSTARGDGIGDFTADEARMLYRPDFIPGETLREDLSFEKAGPRERIFFDPAKTRAAIVTCGGLCPGLNNVIRSVFFQLHHNYGVPEVFGIRYGYRGLNPANGLPPVRLTPDFVESIHKLGGTVLGSSRGPEDPGVMVDFLEKERIHLLFCVGGDGTQRGAHEIALETVRRKLPLAVVGIPKRVSVRRLAGVPSTSRAYASASAVASGMAAVGSGPSPGSDFKPRRNNRLHPRPNRSRRKPSSDLI